MAKKVRVRAAPSPTGMVHIGNIRTFLYDYAYAKRNNGEYILRIEDTDLKRFVPGSVEQILQISEVFGLEPDLYPSSEQIQRIGNTDHWYGKDWMLHVDKLEQVDDSKFENVYVQTQRIALYQKYAWKLVQDGYAYFCFCSEERLKEVNEKKRAAKLPPGYDGHCRDNVSLDEALEKIKKGEEYVVRLNVKGYCEKKEVETLTHTDPLLGKMEFKLSTVNDQVLIKNNGVATYHMAVVVDDHLMKITHPFRGWEWLSSTPKQMMLYDSLGWEMLPYLHLTAILDAGGGKLSKRKGNVGTAEFLEEGYLPDAILNFLMLLGWSPGNDREFFTLDEFIDLFDISGLTKLNPVFDRKKLLWFNGKYIREKSESNLTEIVNEWLEKRYEDDESLKKAMLNDPSLSPKLELLKERISVLGDIPSQLEFFYKRLDVPDYKEIKGIKRHSEEQFNNAKKEYSEIFASYDEDSSKWSKDKWVQDIRDLADKYEWKHADMFMLVRLLICGSAFSPPLFEALQILGKEECLNRLR